MQEREVEKFRDRTPAETISDGYMGIVQATNLNTITQMAMGSVRQCDLKRIEIVVEHPGLEMAMTGLLMNHTRLMAEVQNSITDRTRRK